MKYQQKISPIYKHPYIHSYTCLYVYMDKKERENATTDVYFP